MIPPFLKLDGSSLIFKGEGELCFYIPENYFRPNGSIKYAEISGQYINTLGLFNYEVFDEKKKSVYGLKLFYFPMIVTCMPYQIDRVKDYCLDPKISSPDDYRVLRFRKDDVVILNTGSPISVENVESIYKIFLITGKIPNTIPYDQLHAFLMDSLSYNGSSFGMSAQLFGIIISELCRKIGDESKPFRLAKENNMNKYKSISVKMIPKYTSAFTSITSENWDDAVVNAVINDNKVESNMEKILMD